MPKPYRKMRKYTKSSKKYMQERARRRQIVALSQNGFTQRQIANELHVSEKTVSRDMRKLRGYFERLEFQEQGKIEQVFHECVQRLPRPMGLQVLGALIGAKGTRYEWPLLDALLRGDIIGLKARIRRCQDK